MLSCVNNFFGKTLLETICITSIGKTLKMLNLLYLHAPKAIAEGMVLLLKFK